MDQTIDYKLPPNVFIRWILSLGSPHMTLQDGVAISLSTAWMNEQPPGKAIDPTKRKESLQIFMRAVAPFVFGARRILFETGFTPELDPPREQKEKVLAWINHIFDRLADWREWLHPLLSAAEAGSLPRDPHLAKRLEKIARVSRFFDLAPSDLQGELRRTIRGIQARHIEKRRKANTPENREELLSEIFAHMAPRIVYKDKNGVLRWNAEFLSDKTRPKKDNPIDLSIGEKLQIHADSDLAHDERLRSIAIRAVRKIEESDAADRLDLEDSDTEDIKTLDRLDLEERLDQLDAEDRALVDEALSLNLSLRNWGGREHHRTAEHRGYPHDRKTLRAHMCRILKRLGYPA